MPLARDGSGEGEGARRPRRQRCRGRGDSIEGGRRHVGRVGVQDERRKVGDGEEWVRRQRRTLPRHGGVIGARGDL